MAKSKASDSRWPGWMTPFLVVVLLATPVCLWWYIGWRPAQRAWAVSLNDGRSSSEKFGTYGDGFGAVNSLASSLALGGVAIALLLQWREQHHSSVEAKQSEKREIDLAMLAALVHSRSTLVETFRTMADMAESRVKGLVGGERNPEYTLAVEAWQDSEAAHLRQIKELTALVDFAEVSCGWNVTKSACMPHLTEYYQTPKPEVAGSD